MTKHPGPCFFRCQFQAADGVVHGIQDVENTVAYGNTHCDQPHTTGPHDGTGVIVGTSYPLLCGRLTRPDTPITCLACLARPEGLALV